MDSLQYRVQQNEEKLQSLRRTLQQLKASPALPTQNNNNDDTNNQVLLSGLRKIREKLLQFDQERAAERQHLSTVRDAMKHELLAIKKEVLVDGLRSTPQQFRSDLEAQLQSLKQQLLALKLKEQQAQPQSQSQLVESSPLSAQKKDALRKVRDELIAIKQDMLRLKTNNNDNNNNSSSEQQQLVQLQTEMDAYRQMLTQKLLALKSEIQRYEDEVSLLKQQNEEFKNGQRIPELLQKSISSKLNHLKEDVFAIETENKSLRMQLNASQNQHPMLSLLSMPKSMFVTTVDMHCGGQPLRIVESGMPSLVGNTLSDKRQCVMNKLDYYRKFLMHEPRGHFDMYGVIVTEADADSGADFAVLFMHNEGYSSMCGHGMIALGRYAVDFGLVSRSSTAVEEKKEKDDGDGDGSKNETTVRIQCPSGVVTVNVTTDDNGRSTGAVSFVSCPAWAEHISASIHLDQFGKVELDVGYGGDYKVICPSTRFNLSVRDSPIEDLINISTLIQQTVAKKLQLSHPDSKDLQFLHGTILTDGVNSATEPTCNVCVFADRQVDRSPTGSGVIARLAVDYKKKNIKIGEKRKFIGKTGAVFTGEIVSVMEEYKGKKDAIIAKVSGTAKYVGRSQFILEEGDELGRGFLLK
eukprot:CAMPEP_0202701980 /NCGR_PEP_ID=MMETSP1385-20130828/15022_1 /ASSEMBLY_ACC=CAM_ASM_000861 /TAXON_ID=933848 /ORGANISM="Elphidium margaritaceum" /LENGTH=636 /DNA_ID=CAMNT_0049359525 /DNA_START=54 /DNA_END=1964 /DNA_ORIENTATION=-